MSETKPTITGLNFTLDPEKLLTFKDRGAAENFAHHISEVTGSPVSVNQAGPAKYPNMQTFTLITCRGGVMAPRFSGEYITGILSSGSSFVMHGGWTKPEPATEVWEDIKTADYAELYDLVCASCGDGDERQPEYFGRLSVDFMFPRILVMETKKGSVAYSVSEEGEFTPELIKLKTSSSI